MSSKQKKTIRNSLLLLLTAAIWGFAFVSQTIGAAYVGPFTFIATRNLLAVAVLLPILMFRGRTQQSDGKDGKQTRRESAGMGKHARYMTVQGGLVTGILLFLACYTQQRGVALTTTAKAGFITALYVVLVPLISVFLGKKVYAGIWISVILSIVGLFLLCFREGELFESGDLFVLICALLFALQILTVNHYSAYIDGITLSFLEMLTTAILASVCMVLFEGIDMVAIRAALIPILYAGILSSGVGYTLQIIAQKELDPTVASLIMCLESVFSAIGGWVILRQGLSGREIIGCVLMFAAIVLAQIPTAQKEAAESHNGS